MLWSDLPYAEPERLMVLTERPAEAQRGELKPSSAGNFLDWRALQPQVFEDLAAFRGTSLSLGDGGGTAARAVGAAEVSPSLFSLLGVDAEIGRVLEPDEEIVGRDLVTVVTHAFWIDQLGGRPEAVGEPLRLDGSTYEIVGVLPRDFEFINPQVQLYVPLVLDGAAQDRGRRDILAVARLAPGVAPEAAQSAMAEIMSRLVADFPQANRGRALDVLPMGDVVPMIGPRYRTLFGLIQGGMILVLLITCANLANLLVVRQQARDRDVAVRISLGARRGGVALRVLGETLILAALSGLVALAVAWAATRLLGMVLAAAVPSHAMPVLGLSVLVFHGLSTLLGGLLVALGPTLQVFRTRIVPALKEGGGLSLSRGRRWVMGSLVVLELALAFVLLSGAATLLRSFERMQSADPGFATRDLLVGGLHLPPRRYPDASSRLALSDRLVERLGALPGVRGVARSDVVPRSPVLARESFATDAAAPVEERAPQAFCLVVDGEFFDVLGLKLHAGRRFDPRDHLDSSPVVAVNAVLARKVWGGEGEAVGHRLRVRGALREVVGVVADARHDLGGRDDLMPTLYLPWSQMPPTDLRLVARGEVEAAALGSAVREIDADLAAESFEQLDRYVDRFWLGQKILTVLLDVFGVVALLLAALGTYGALAFAVARRSREIGLRMALGAGRGRLIGLILAQGLMLGALGLALGLGLVLWVHAVLRSTMEDVAAVGVESIAAIALLLLAVALAAAAAPAWRAASVEPNEALRWE